MRYGYLAAGAAIAGLTACSAAAAAQDDGGTAHDKVFVCKYVRTPGGDLELSQTGDNPISVSVNAIGGDPATVDLGDEFNDEQGLSIVIAFDTGQEEPSPGDCPVIPSTTTTTAASTTTTTAASTTTTTTPTGTQFSFPSVQVVCPPPGDAIILITFPDRPDLDGEPGQLLINDADTGDLLDDIDLPFVSEDVVEIPFPGTDPVTLSYFLGDDGGAPDVVVGPIEIPEECVFVTTTTTEAPTTTTTQPATTTTQPGGVTTTTQPGATTTTQPGSATTQPPAPAPKPPAPAPGGELPGTL